MGEWKGLDTGRMPVFLGYDQTERMIAALLDRAARWQPDAVVGIARGGLVPATMAAGILAFKTVGVVPDTETRFYFVAIDNARFRKPVEPGDQLVLKVTLKRAFKGIWKFHGLAEVDGAEVASAEIMVAPETKTPKAKGVSG